MAKIILEIEKCWDGCPYCTPRFGGCGDADDWKCKKANRYIATYHMLNIIPKCLLYLLGVQFV